MVIINFTNKQEIIIIIIVIEKKPGINSWSGEKKSGKNIGWEKESRGKILSLAENLVTFPQLFPPDKVDNKLVAFQQFPNNGNC